MDKTETAVPWSSVLKFVIVGVVLLLMTHRDYELIEQVNAVETVATQSPDCVPYMEMSMPIGATSHVSRDS